MATDNKRKLYDALSQDYDMGSYEQFCADLNDEGKRRKLYDATSQDYDLGTWDSFSKQLGYGKAAKPASAPAAPSVEQPTVTKYYILRRGGKDFTVSTDEVNAAGGLSGWAKAHPGAPLRVYMLGTDEKGKAFDGHVDLSVAHDHFKKRGYKYATTDKAIGMPTTPHKTWQPSVQDKIRMSYQMDTMLNDFNQNSKERVAQFQRMTEPYTAEGRKKISSAKFQAQLAGAPTKVMGLTPPAPVPVSDDGGAQGADGEKAEDAKPSLWQEVKDAATSSAGAVGQSPVLYGVKYVDGRPVTQWLLPDGSVTTSLFEADQAEYVARTSRLDKKRRESIDEQIQQVEAELEELRKKADERGDAVVESYERENNSYFAQVAQGMQMMHGNTPFSGGPNRALIQDSEFKALTTAIRQREEQLKDLYEERDRQMGTDVGFWRGFGRVMGDPRTWDLGIGNMMDAITMVNADKYLSPNATEGEQQAGQAMMKAIYDAQQTEQMYGGNASWWNRAGVMAGYMPSFIRDFALTGNGFEALNVAGKAAAKGAAKVIGKEAIEEIAKLGVKAYAKKYGVRGVGRMAGSWAIKALGTTADDLLIRAPLMTNTIQGASTAADIIGRKLGDVVVDENGNYDFTNDKTWGSAVWQGEANAIIENYSEMFGAHLDGVVPALAKTFGGKRISGMLARANASSYGKILATTRKQFQRLGVSDYFGEVGEEYYGQLWRTMLNLDDAYTNVPVLDKNGNQVLDAEGNPVYERKNLLFTGQFNGDIWGGMALSMGLMGAGKYTISGIAYGNMKHQVNKADKRAAEIFTPERWEPIRELIDNTANDDIGALAESMVIDQNLSDYERSAVMEYMERSLNLRGHNLGAMAQGRGTAEEEEVLPANIEVDGELSQSYIDGYEASSPQEMNDAQNMYEYQRQRAEGMFEPDMLDWFDSDPVNALMDMSQKGIFSQEEIDAARDYINAKTVRDGILQRVNDNIDEQIAQSDAMINGRINPATGMIQPVLMGLDDRQVYVVGGSLSVNPDGTIDQDASDESIVVRDAQTGELEFTDPKSIVSAGEAIDPEMEKAIAVDNIRQQAAQAAADAMNGTLAFNPGDNIQINDGGGAVQVTVVGPVLDEESGLPIEDQIVVQFPDGRQAAFAKEQLQAFADATNLERLNEFEQRRAAERAQQHATEAEAMRPQFALNDEFTIFNDTGTPIRGSITRELDEDGMVEVYTEEPINGNKVNRFTPAELEEMFDTYNGTPTTAVVPENVEPVPNPAETASEPQQSALSRIPVDEQGQPKYDDVNPDAAWDAIVEQAQGDEAIAAEVVADIVAERQEDFNAAEKALAKTKEGKPEKRKKGDPAPTMAERIAAKNAAKAALAEAQAIRDKAKAALDHWKKIAGTKQRRESERLAAEFGLTPEAIAAFEQPILVNMLDVSDADAITLGQYVAQDTESGGIERIKPKNAVKKMGDKIRTFANLLLRSADDEATFAQLVDANGLEVLKWMNQQGYITNTQYASAFDSKGNLSAEAANDLKGIMYQSIFTGGSTRLEEMFNKMPAKAQRAILATAFSDYDSPFADRMINEIQQSIIAFNALMGYEQFRNATNAETAQKAVAEWGKLYAFDDVSGESYLPSETFSNFALALAAMYKGNTQKHIQSVFNMMYDIVQGTEQDNLFEVADKTPKPLAEAIRRALNIEYEPIVKPTTDNGSNGSPVLDINSENGQDGRPGSDGNPDGAEQPESKAEPSDSGTGTASDSGQGGELATEEADFTPEEIEALSHATFTNSATGQTIKLTGHTIMPDGRPAFKGNMDGGRGSIGRFMHNLIRKILNSPSWTTDAVMPSSQSEAHDFNDLETSAIAERIDIDDDDWTEGEDNNPTYKRTITIDGKYKVIQVDEPDSNGFYTGSYFEFNGGRFGDLGEVISHIDKQAKLAADIAAAESEVNTDPTPGQKEAGNYKKGHVQVGTFDVTIEQPVGSVRRGKDADGKEWETTMHNTYGYIRGTEGVDGDHIDVFLSTDIDAWNGRRVVIVDQYNTDGSFDEHKVMLGFNEKADAINAYLANYEKGWEKGRRLVFSTATLEDFEKWIESSHRKTKPFHEYKSVSVEADEETSQKLTPEEEAEIAEATRMYGYKNAMRDTSLPFLSDKEIHDKIKDLEASIAENRAIGYMALVAQALGDEGRVRYLKELLERRKAEATTDSSEQTNTEAPRDYSEGVTLTDGRKVKGISVSRTGEVKPGGNPRDIFVYHGVNDRGYPVDFQEKDVPESEVTVPDTPSFGKYQSFWDSYQKAIANKQIPDVKRIKAELAKAKKRLKTLEQGAATGISSDADLERHENAVKDTTDAIRAYEAVLADIERRMADIQTADNADGYTIDTYTTKSRKEGNKAKEYVRVIFPRADKAVWQERLNLAKKMGGTSVPKGYGFKTKEEAEAFAKAVSDPSAVADAQPLSLDDIRPTSGVAQVDVEGLMLQLSETGEANLADHSTPVEAAPDNKGEEKPEEKPVNPSGNRLVTDERYAELRERMRKKLGGQLNMGVDPEILAIGTEMAVYHIEKGARKFKAYASAMIADLGDVIRPYLKSFYNAVRDMPEAEAAGLVSDMDSYDEVRSVDIANFDKPGTDAMATAAAVVAEQEAEDEKAEAERKLQAYRHLVNKYAQDIANDMMFKKAVSLMDTVNVQAIGSELYNTLVGNDIATIATNDIYKMFVDQWNINNGTLQSAIIAEAIRKAHMAIRDEQTTVNPDGTTSQTVVEAGTEIEITSGDFIPGVRPTVNTEKKPGGKKKPGKAKPKPTTDGGLFDAVEDDTTTAPAIAVPEQRPEAELMGDSAAYQERETQTVELVEEIGGVIESRVAMLQLDPESVKPLTMTDVKTMASKYPALKEISDTDLQELVELAMTQLTRSEAIVNIDGTAEQQRSAYDHIVNLYQIQPSLNARDSERLIKQQYSTPTPFGFVMGQFVRAGGKAVGSMLEPSAGNGALTITVHPSAIHVNDIDDARLANLRKLGFGRVTAQDALLPFSGDKVDVVMTNPPFGTITEKVYDDIFRISSLEGQMAINAMEQMKDDGRAAIVIGGNTSYRTNGSMNPKDAAFFGYLYSHYNVADVINISGKALYSRNGTGYDVRMILIDGRKTGEFQRVYPPVKAKARAEQITTFDELYKRVQDDIQQIQQMGSQSANVQRDPETAADGTASAPVRSGNNRPNTGAGQRPGTTGDAVRDTPRTDSGQPTPGNVGSRPAGVDNADTGNAGSTDNVPQSKPEQPRSVGGGSTQNGTGRSGSDGRGAVASRPDRGAERLEVKPDLTTEKVPYPNQSGNGFTLMSVVPAAQAQVLQKSLGEIGDVDQYLVDELGYSSKEELYGYLAAEQIDSVALAIHQMDKGNAFVIGDMTGVGKGRQGAALIRYAVKQGKVPIYFTQKPTLYTDNYRDLCDIGSSDLRPFIIASNPKDANIVDADGNVVHKLPSKKEQERVFNYIMEHGTLPDEYDYVLTTYDQIKNGTADYSQNEDGTWNTEARKLPKKSKGYTTADYNGQARRDALAKLAEGNITILDESHTVGGDSGCGRYMQMLTSQAGGVTFLSATFAKRADNMPIYAQRTAIAEAGVKASELIEAIMKGGVTLQEIMSKQLVESGQMIRRERSFDGVTIDWLSVAEETDRRQRQQFNEVADIFNAIRNFQDDYITPIIDAKNEEAAEFGATVGHTQGTKDMGVKNVPFASKMYNLVNQLLFALKVDAVADRVVENLRNGYKPVISFTNTMEGFLSSATKGVAMDDVPNFSLTLMRALDGVMRFTEKDADENSEGGSISLSELSTEGQNAYNAIREKIMNLSADLPISPMDAIRMKIEEAGYSVAEITGRTMQLNRTADGKYIVEARKDRDKKAAMRDFNSGKLDVLMINKSGSTGISLHASSKFEDQRPRVMVFAQFQSDINDEVQMRGRIDRSGQVTRGRYEYIMSTIPAEQRIQMMFKAKLKSLDANTTSSQKSKFNEMEIVDYLNKYGDEVVWEYMKEHPELEERLGDPLDMLQEKKDDDAPRTSEKEDTSKKTGCAGKISRYLAFLSVEEQDEIFREITEAYRVKIQLLDDAGENDLEITTMPLRAETKRKQIWHEGENPGSGNAFADNTYVEEVEVDVLKKPMKRDEIIEATRKLVGDKGIVTEYDQMRYGSKVGEVNWTRYAREKEAEISQFFQEKADDAVGKLREAGEARIAKAREKAVAAATKARVRGENNFTDAEIQSLADTVANEEREKEERKQDKRRSEIMGVKSRIQTLLNRLRAGSIYVVPQDLKQGTPEMFSQTFGTFVGFKFNKSYTLGSSTAIFATLDGRRKVELALSDPAINTIISATEMAYRYSPKEINAITMENWDSNVPTQTRQKRYIITGNLLQALVDTEKGEKTRGNLISYSTIDGETRQGILMGENFKLTDLRNSASLSSRLAQIREGKAVVSENGDVQISKDIYDWRHRGEYELRVPKSKQRGGIYTMHPGLLKLVEGHNFITKGNNMVAYVTDENIANVVDMLSRAPFNLTVLQESQLSDASTHEAEEGFMYRTSSEIDAEYPNWLEGTTTENGKHSTQVEGTRKTYGKVGDWIENNLGKDVEILDASSGMGYGTTDLRERGFNIEDVEPYQSEQRKANNPATYDSYGKISKQYDFIISNAVLNVVPDDWRSDVLHDMASRLKAGGKLFINTRKTGEEKSIKDKIELDSPQEVLVKRNGKIASYQKFFTPKELKEWVASELGEEYDVEIANEKNSGTKGLAAVVVTRNENINRMGDGYGAYSDEEISFANDPVSKVMGKNRFSKKRQAEFAARERQRMADRIKELAERMNLDNVEILTDASQLEGKRAKAKGFYNKRTGKITIVIPNNVSTIDAEQTLLHEAVAHYGLRQLFGEQFNTFLDNVYQSADESIRRKITEMAAKNGWDFRTATEEYLAGLAEDTNFNEARNYGGWWSQIKRLFLDMLEKIGFEGFRDKVGVVLTDNELRYILWRSYENLAEPGRYRSILGEAADVVKQSKLKVGNYAELGIEAEYAAEPISVVNDSFNKQLERWINGQMRPEEVISLGHPKGVISYFLPNSPILLRQRVLSKSRKKHGLTGHEMKNLPDALANPVFVFKSNSETISVLTTLKSEKGENLFVAIELEKDLKFGGNTMVVNDILTIHGRETENVVLPIIHNDTLAWVDKGKGLEWLHSAKSKSQAITSQDLISATKVVKSFDNPTIEEEELFRPGDFSPRDRVFARYAYESMVRSGSYQFKEAVQDSMLGLKALYQAILGKKTRLEDVAGFENAYLFENRMSSMNAGEQHEYFQRYMQPLLKEIGRIAGANKRKRMELTDYIMAKHGLERNAYMRNEAAANGEDTDRDFAGLIGLTGEADWQSAEATAQQWVDDYESSVDTTALWQAINDATKATLEKIYLSGLLSKETYEKILGMYQFYIPLRGWNETTSEQVYGYLTSKDGPLGGSIIKKAEGRESMADDPIATIGMMADDSIRQGNRNLMKQRFLNFILNHPSDAVSVHDIWLEYDDVNDEWRPVFADVEATDTSDEVAQKVEAFEQRMEALRNAEPDKYKKGREAQHIPYKVVKGNLREHQILIKRNGRTFVATINGNPRAAQALNGLTNPDVDQNGVVGNMLKAGTWINRQLSAFYTTRNPDFVVSNFFRDALYSNCMTWVKESPRYARRFHKNFGRVNPIVMRRLLGKWEKGKLNMSNRIEALFYQFMKNGGETGYTNVRDIEGHKRAVAAELKKQGSTGRRVWTALGMQLDLLNRSAENCARFAAFVTSREFGRNIDRAIYDAKEISVNFNKKGSGGKMVNANGQTVLGKAGSYLGGGGRLLYVFWNAGIQGFTNFGRQAKLHPAKFTAGATALFALGYVIPMLAQMLGGGDGDDDDKNAYYNLPEYIRRSNICFYAGEQWITIPLPIEYRAMYGMGELAHGVISGNERYTDAELGQQMAAQISQIMPLDMLEGGGGISPFIPSAAKPFTEAYIMNKSWTGLPVYKDTPFNKNDPEWTKAYASADKHLVAFAKWLNEVSGGDDFKKGAIDINTAKIEYLLNGTFGGMLTFPNKIKKTGETMFGDRDFEWRNMPIANRLIKSGDERTANRKLQNEYFKYKKEYEATGQLMRKYENADEDGIMGYAERINFLENSPEYARWEIFDEFKADIDAYREEIAAETDKEERAKLEAEMYAVMRELVNALHDPEAYRNSEQQ